MIGENQQRMKDTPIIQLKNGIELKVRPPKDKNWKRGKVGTHPRHGVETPICRSQYRIPRYQE